MSEFIPESEVVKVTPPKRQLWVGTWPDGSQLMVERWFHHDGQERAVTAARRSSSDTRETWGPPITLTKED